ncbi:MAG: 8-amino-7-oxononanoate synthase [Buchnera aphidicola (Meitanaphis microgallis)]
MTWKKRVSYGLNTCLSKLQFRTRIAIKRNNNRIIEINNIKYKNFSSNDYLGLSNDARIIKAWKIGADRYGIGSGGSSFTTGYSIIHQSLEEELAEWMGYHRAILFISGFTANESVIMTLIKKGDRIFADKLSHASLLMSSHNSPGTLYRFEHNNISSLERQYCHTVQGETLIITEGIFSMDGDHAPLSSLLNFSKKVGSLLLVDDAHGVGILGLEGKGSCNTQKIKPDILTITFSKAFGVNGAAVLCNHDIAEYILQFSKHTIFSTAMPPAQVYTIKKALKCIQKADDLRDKLNSNIQYFLDQSKSLPFEVTGLHSAIQPILVRSNKKSIDLSSRLKSSGLWINAIRPPTVPIHQARIRITLSSIHTQNDIAYLIEKLYELHNK